MNRTALASAVIGILALGWGWPEAPAWAAAKPDAKKGQPGGTEAAKQEARMHYDEGVKLYDLGHFDAAIAEFEAAYRLVPNALLLYNLAQSHRRLNHLEKAVELYRAYLRKEPRAANRADVEQRIAALEGSLGPPNQVVDAREANNQANNPPPPVPPARAPVVMAVAPTDSPASVPPPPSPVATENPATISQTSAAPAERPGAGLRTGGLVVAGAGVALLGAGTFFGLRTQSLSEEARTSPIYNPGKVSDAESAETMQWVLLGTGAAAVATGAVLYWLGSRDAGTPEATAFTVVPGPHGLSIGARGTF